MRSAFKRSVLPILLLCWAYTSATAQEGVSVPHEFQSGTPAVAAEVNANFQALVDAINAQASVIDALQADVNQLQSDLATAEAELAALQGNSVLDLDGYLFLEPNPDGHLTARFDAVNVQITNGLGATNGAGMPYTNRGVVNGLGNLVIGYDDDARAAPFICSNGTIPLGTQDPQGDCEGGGGTWGAYQKSGSHNLILGVGHSYTSHGAIIAGTRNVSNNAWASVTGGDHNLASGFASHISAGYLNRVYGDYSAIRGGANNTVNGDFAGISGGEFNSSLGDYTVLSGGYLKLIVNDPHAWRAGTLFESE